MPSAVQHLLQIELSYEGMWQFERVLTKMLAAPAKGSVRIQIITELAMHRQHGADLPAQLGDSAGGKARHAL